MFLATVLGINGRARFVHAVPRTYSPTLFSAVADTPTVTKADIVDRIAEGTGLTKIETKAVVEGFMSVVSQAMEEGNRVELRGFGVFEVQHRAPRVGRNPQTNERVEIEARHEPVFRPSQQFRDDVDKALDADGEA
jgi:DNA-binding protein HU-beta